ncbi:MAG TPA: T9SS type A sorting domain-containing protein, partial [Candidatus Kapabacteria bacterium]|nr:T9SS type A sorting domain-containing protein [Candidatus Kapabacteria bacterium]
TSIFVCVLAFVLFSNNVKAQGGDSLLITVPLVECDLVVNVFPSTPCNISPEDKTPSPLVIKPLCCCYRTEIINNSHNDFCKIVITEHILNNGADPLCSLCGLVDPSTVSWVYSYNNGVLTLEDPPGPDHQLNRLTSYQEISFAGCIKFKDNPNYGFFTLDVYDCETNQYCHFTTPVIPFNLGDCGYITHSSVEEDPSLTASIKKFTVTNGYPNPSTGDAVYFDCYQLNNSTVNVEIIDATGKILQRKSMPVGGARPTSIQINSYLLPPGTYVAKFSTGASQESRTFIVSH